MKKKIIMSFCYVLLVFFLLYIQLLFITEKVDEFNTTKKI